MDPRRLKNLLEGAGVQLLRCQRYWLVPLSELEAKVRPLWESVCAAEAFRHAATGSEEP